ncbi:MAG: ABC transporter permease subunit [Candidatus Latescibacterota bacterium]|jgi:ABC-type transport system involved in multi-copper enzyme maturation permease subunit
MIWTIARKEFLTSLLTWRFVVSLGACVVLMGMSALVLGDDYAARVEIHRAEVSREQARLDQIKVYAQLELYVERPPSPLSVFSEGLEKRLGNVLPFSHAHVPTMLTWRKENSPLMDAFPAFDLATIAGLLFSLLALFLSYDAVAGEREAGTLRLIGANAIARHEILVGKWIGGMLCAVLPALGGYLVALAVLTIDAVHLTGADWLAALLIIAASLAYLSLFYLAGLCLSVRFRLSSTALALGALLWAATTIVLPTVSSYLVAETMPMLTEGAAKAARKEAGERFRRQFGGINAIQAAGVGASYHVDGTSPLGTYLTGAGLYREVVPQLQAFYAEAEPQRTLAAEEIGRFEDQVVADRVTQVELDRLLSRVLVAPALGHAAAALAGTDLDSYQGFIAYSRRCRHDLVRFLQEHEVFASPSFFTQDRTEELLSRAEAEARVNAHLPPKVRWPDQWTPLDHSTWPGFAAYRAPVASGLGRAAVDLAILGLGNVLLLLLALRWFLRRQLV